MKLSISRTSSRCMSEDTPCEGCENVKVSQYIDVRTFKNKEEWLTKFPEDSQNVISWGITPEGNPFRVLPRIDALWVKTFKNFSELMEFVKEHGECVLSEPLSYKRYVDSPNLDGHLEIYDTYRE